MVDECCTDGDVGSLESRTGLHARRNCHDQRPGDRQCGASDTHTELSPYLVTSRFAIGGRAGIKPAQHVQQYRATAPAGTGI